MQYIEHFYYNCIWYKKLSCYKKDRQLFVDLFSPLISIIVLSFLDSYFQYNVCSWSKIPHQSSRQSGYNQKRLMNECTFYY